MGKSNMQHGEGRRGNLTNITHSQQTCPAPVSVDFSEKQACMLVNGLDSLADELWQNVLGQLCLTDLLNCCRTNKRLHSVSQNDSIWSSLYETEFGVRCCPRAEQTCRDAFRERYPFANNRLLATGQPTSCIADVRSVRMHVKSSTGASTAAKKTASKPVAVTEQSPGQGAALHFRTAPFCSTGVSCCVEITSYAACIM